MLAFTAGSIVPTTRKDIGERSHRILSSALSSLHTLYIYMGTFQTELISPRAIYTRSFLYGQTGLRRMQDSVSGLIASGS